jgi:hypothetical protein
LQISGNGFKNFAIMRCRPGSPKPHLTAGMGATLIYKLLYFVQFCGYGVLSPYIPIFYESLALPKSQIGILTMMPNVGAFLVAPVFGFIGITHPAAPY